jgi:subtilisin family serine protease
MRKTLAAAGLFGSLTVISALSAVPAQAQPYVEMTAVSGHVVPGEYIVTTRPGAGREVSARGGTTTHVYEHAMHGFAAKLTARQLRELQRDRDVLAIEPNQLAHAQSVPAVQSAVQAVQSPTPNWGVDRIDQRNLPLTNSYTYFNTGAGVTAYILDTGINPTHPDFGGRAAVAYDALGGDGIDCNGHGTHVAGTVGSTTYGVAKRVQLRGVRVLGCTGSGTFADVIEGVDWVQANSPGPSVALMAIGGAKSPAVDAAVNSLTASGVFLAVSGGSSASDACNFSPTGAAGAFAVIRSTATDQSASSNNFGPCVKLHAPGALIVSTWLGTGTATLSGTSMAAAHAAGLAAMFKQAVGDTPSSVVGAWLVGVATSGVLTGVHPQSPNLLLYTNLI